MFYMLQHFYDAHSFSGFHGSCKSEIDFALISLKNSIKNTSNERIRDHVQQTADRQSFMFTSV